MDTLSLDTITCLIQSSGPHLKSKSKHFTGKALVDWIVESFRSVLQSAEHEAGAFASRLLEEGYIEDTHDADDRSFNVSNEYRLKERSEEGVSAFMGETEQLLFVDDYLLLRALVAHAKALDDSKMAFYLCTVALHKGHALGFVESLLHKRFSVLHEGKVVDSALALRMDQLDTWVIRTLFMRLGSSYLKSIIRPIVCLVCQMPTSFEIDPNRLPNPFFVPGNQVHLQRACEHLLSSLEESVSSLPPLMRRILNRTASLVEQYMPGSLHTSAGNVFFLRFLNPAIVAPECCGASDDSVITSAARRALILITKVMQNVANRVGSGEHKESWMAPMSSFVDECVPRVEPLLDQLMDVGDDGGELVFDAASARAYRAAVARVIHFAIMSAEAVNAIIVTETTDASRRRESLQHSSVLRIHKLLYSMMQCGADEDGKVIVPVDVSPKVFHKHTFISDSSLRTRKTGSGSASEPTGPHGRISRHRSLSGNDSEVRRRVAAKRMRKTRHLSPLEMQFVSARDHLTKTWRNREGADQRWPVQREVGSAVDVSFAAFLRYSEMMSEGDVMVQVSPGYHYETGHIVATKGKGTTFDLEESVGKGLFVEDSHALVPFYCLEYFGREHVLYVVEPTYESPNGALRSISFGAGVDVVYDTSTPPGPATTTTTSTTTTTTLSSSPDAHAISRLSKAGARSNQSLPTLPKAVSSSNISSSIGGGSAGLAGAPEGDGSAAGSGPAGAGSGEGAAEEEGAQARYGVVAVESHPEDVRCTAPMRLLLLTPQHGWVRVVADLPPPGKGQRKRVTAALQSWVRGRLRQLHQEDLSRAQQALVEFEERSVPADLTIGVLYQREGQRAWQDMCRNRHGESSSAYRRFLRWLGWSVRLSEHDGYRGGLDCRGTDTTGTHSVYASVAVMPSTGVLLSSPAVPRKAAAAKQGQKPRHKHHLGAPGSRRHTTSVLATSDARRRLSLASGGRASPQRLLDQAVHSAADMPFSTGTVSLDGTEDAEDDDSATLTGSLASPRKHKVAGGGPGGPRARVGQRKGPHGVTKPVRAGAAHAGAAGAGEGNAEPDSGDDSDDDTAAVNAPNASSFDPTESDDDLTYGLAGEDTTESLASSTAMWSVDDSSADQQWPGSSQPMQVRRVDRAVQAWLGTQSPGQSSATVQGRITLSTWMGDRAADPEVLPPPPELMAPSAVPSLAASTRTTQAGGARGGPSPVPKVQSQQEDTAAPAPAVGGGADGGAEAPTGATAASPVLSSDEGLVPLPPRSSPTPVPGGAGPASGEDADAATRKGSPNGSTAALAADTTGAADAVGAATADASTSPLTGTGSDQRLEAVVAQWIGGAPHGHTHVPASGVGGGDGGDDGGDGGGAGAWSGVGAASVAPGAAEPGSGESRQQRGRSRRMKKRTASVRVTSGSPQPPPPPQSPAEAPAFRAREGRISVADWASRGPRSLDDVVKDWLGDDRVAASPAVGSTSPEKARVPPRMDSKRRHKSTRSRTLQAGDMVAPTPRTAVRLALSDWIGDSNAQTAAEPRRGAKSRKSTEPGAEAKSHGAAAAVHAPETSGSGSLSRAMWDEDGSVSSGGDSIAVASSSSSSVELRIMFHVCTLLPFEEDATSSQLHRKRHIGTDSVVIVFRDAHVTTAFDPDSVASSHNQVFLVVEEAGCDAMDDSSEQFAVEGRAIGGEDSDADTRKESGTLSAVRYRIQVVAKQGAGQLWMLVKVINAYRAAMCGVHRGGIASNDRGRFLRNLTKH